MKDRNGKTLKVGDRVTLTGEEVGTIQDLQDVGANTGVTWDDTGGVFFYDPEYLTFVARISGQIMRREDWDNEPERSCLDCAKAEGARIEWKSEAYKARARVEDVETLLRHWMDEEGKVRKALAEANARCAQLHADHWTSLRRSRVAAWLAVISSAGLALAGLGLL